MMINHNELCQAFAEFMNRYPFTAFVSLTDHSKVITRQNITPGYELKVNSFLAGIEASINSTLGAMGLHTLKYGGHLHSHFLLLKYSGEGFSSEELRLIERRWHRLADAQEVTRQVTLTEYISSDKHMTNCRTFDYYIYGEEVLKAIT